jgi:nucleoside-diphosphate-sugar epimerase
LSGDCVNRVLVTGAGGFIGRHVVSPLLQHGFKVHVASRTALDAPQVHQHRLDLFDEAAVSRLLESVRPTHLIHLAWYTQPPEYWYSPINSIWENCSLHLFEAFVRSGGKRLVGTGTCAEYEWGEDVLREASTPEMPATPYGCAKLSLKRRSEKLAMEAGISFSWARLFFLFGPHERKGRFVSSIVDSLLRGENAHCRNGDLLRDLLYVEDAGDAIVALATSNVEGTVNVASGIAAQLGHVALEIGQAMSRLDLVRIAAGGSAGTEPRSLVADVSRLRREVGWIARFSRHEAIQRTIAWHEAQERINAA